MRYKATLVPSGRIVRDPNMAVRLVRSVPPGQTALAGAESATPTPVTPPAIPRGADRWYDALTTALIEWYPYVDATSVDTQNWQHGAWGEQYTVDDEFDYEGAVVHRSWSIYGLDRSAWWAIQVPPDAAPGVTITIDNFLSAVGPDNPWLDDNLDLTLSLITTDVDPIPTIELPSTEFDFSDLYEVAYNDDCDDPTTGYSYRSRIALFSLEPGKTYWLRVAAYFSYGDNRDQATYRLRVTITIPA